MPATKFLLRDLLFIAALLLSGFGNVSAQSVSAQRLDFESRQQSLDETLLSLSRTSGVPIGYSGRLLDTPRQVSISSKDERLSAILDRLLENSGLGWRESNGQILVFKKPPPERILSGFVEDASSGERLVGAFLMELNSGRSATTNSYGFFSFSVPGNQAAMVVVSMLGFHVGRKQLSGGPAQKLVLQLQPAQTEMAAVEISSDSVAGALRAFYPLKEENLARIPLGLLPAPGGETDLMRAAMLLPGIESSIDGLGGWSVRGGDSDQNLVLVDDAVVFHPEHALGLFSVFNPDIVRSARLWKGDAPARLGGRVASALDVRTREGNLERIAGSASLGWMAARLAIEIPLRKEKGAMLFSARRSLAGPVLKYYTRKSMKKDGWDGATDYHFSDLNWKTFWAFNNRNRVYLSLYQGSDFFKDQRNYTETEFIEVSGPDLPPISTLTFYLASRYQWKNRFASLRWNRIFSDNCFANTTLTASHFALKSSNQSTFSFQEYGGTESFSDTFSSASQTKLFDYTLKTDVDWYASRKLTLRGGGQVSALHVMPFYYFGNAALLPYWVVLDDDALPEASRGVKFEKGITLAAHGEAEWKPGLDWQLRAGMRLETFSNRGKTWFLPQPRISLEKKWASGLNGSASWSVMAQPLRTVSPNYIESAGDVWLLASPALPPQQTSQLTAGLGWAGAGWSARTTVFYKTMNRLETYAARWSTYVDSLYFTDPNQIVSYNNGLRSWEQEIELGRGRAVGLEAQLEKTTGNTTGWVSWTLSKSERKFENLNDNRWYAARFDRRHHVKLALFQRLGKHFSLSATWQLASGDAISRLLISSSKRVRLVDIHGEGLSVERLGYGDYRQPWQHRLDLNAVWKWQTGKVRHQISAGFYNTYNRANTYFTYWITSEENNLPPEPQQIKGLPWLPHLTWGAQF